MKQPASPYKTLVSLFFICLYFQFLGWGCLTTNGEEFKTITQRLQDRKFPSIFMAWNPAGNLQNLSREENMARHDLVFVSVPTLGLQWNNPSYGLATNLKSNTIPQAMTIRKNLLKRNKNIILLAELRYRDAWNTFLPEKNPWWKRDKQGTRIPGWKEGNYYLLDFQNPAYQSHIAQRAKALIKSGVFDGIMLDWWKDDDSRLALIQVIRKDIGEKPLILVNANDHTTPATAPYINGYFMECWRSKTPDHWKQIQHTLLFAEKNLHSPHINCVETWFEHSRQDLNRMRATTCLVLTCSDGYALFSDPNDLPSPDHQHDWYPFWNKSLGHPVTPGIIHETGWARREYENGTAVYNPMGNKPITLTFKEPRTSLATGNTAKVHTIPALDGDILLKQIP